MITRLPNWVWTGGWILAFVAGYINVTGLLGFSHQGITHLTGTTSLLGAAVAERDLALVVRLGGLISAYVAGSSLSGWIIGDSTLQLGKRYGVTLMIEALALCAAIPLLQQEILYGEWLTAGACGLQNAMATTYSGATLRTCHVSGMFTDLGIHIGHLANGTPVLPQRLQLCVVVISGFFIGSISGTILFSWLSYYALYLPAVITGSAGMLYSLTLLVRERLNIAK